MLLSCPWVGGSYRFDQSRLLGFLDRLNVWQGTMENYSKNRCEKIRKFDFPQKKLYKKV